MTATVTSRRFDPQVGRDGFARVLHAEWTKFRTVRGWVIGIVVAALLIVALGLFTASGSNCSDLGKACPAPPVGPGGQAVDDEFYFAHRPLAGNGSITARLASLTGRYLNNGIPSQNPTAGMRNGVQPWAKAGIMIKQNTKAGSAYAAMMATGRHGVRMQYDFTHDIAGSASSSHWLRLTRTGDTITGFESADGSHWTRVGTAHLAGLSGTVQVGLFAASPDHMVTSTHLGGGSTTGGPAQATGVLDHVSLQGVVAGGNWHAEAVGNGDRPLIPQLSRFTHSDGDFTVSGTGDIAPKLDGQTSTQTVGAFAGVIAMIVVGTMFVTAEYRRGLIRTTLSASPRRGRVLAAKAVVIGGITFAAGLAAIAIVIPLGNRILRANGNPLLPVPFLTELRIVVGTAALLAVATVLAMSVGAILRRGSGAITLVIAATVLPYFLATANALPIGASNWLLRITPAAAFAVQQSLPKYFQVLGDYTPANGYFPLPPWAGFAVLCGYAVLALGVAGYLLRRRDA